VINASTIFDSTLAMIIHAIKEQDQLCTHSKPMLGCNFDVLTSSDWEKIDKYYQSNYTKDTNELPPLPPLEETMSKLSNEKKIFLESFDRLIKGVSDISPYYHCCYPYHLLVFSRLLMI